MIIKVVVNNNTTYKLVRWNSQEFNSNLTLIIQSINLVEVRDAFQHIEKLDIYQDELLVATYTSFDTYAQITYLGKEYVEGEKIFADAMSITLTKANIVDQVQRLDDQINAVVDPSTLSLEELKDYKLKQISEACSADIYAGDTIVLSDGTREHFKYDVHDQLNLISLFSLAIAAPEMELYPYHCDSASCSFYSRADVIRIVAMLLIRKTRLITYCNQLTLYVRSMTNIEDVRFVEYGMDLPAEYQNVIDNIMAGTMEQVEKFINRIMPPESDESGEQGDETPTDETPTDETPTDETPTDEPSEPIE